MEAETAPPTQPETDEIAAAASHVSDLVWNAFSDPARAAAMFRALEEHGLHVTPVHFYSPIPDTRTLPPDLWERESPLFGVDLDVAGQLRLIRDVFPQFSHEYGAIPVAPTEVPHEFFLGNGLFDGTDALVLYCMIRHFRPRRIVEVGSGLSSRLMAAAALRNGRTELTCIEPYPDDVLRAGFPGLGSLVEARVQDVNPAVFAAIEENDILFIDSSHVVAVGSDVRYLFDRVIPAVRPGVLVHLHDIYFPADYPREWVEDEFRFWNEQYLLQAFLAFNHDFEIVLANNYLGRHHGGDLASTFPTSPWVGGASFWMRRRGR